jgi:Ca2+-binding EF-hand superfamily protein
MVDFKPNEYLQSQLATYWHPARQNKDITYEQVMRLFSLKNDKSIKQIDVKNAFRMLSKEYGERDGMIHKTRIRELLEDIGVDEVEVQTLLSQLEPDCKDGWLNFEEFVDRQF